MPLVLTGKLNELLKKALAQVYPGQEIPVCSFEHPANQEHGDFACNLALTLSKSLKLPPRQIAENLLKKLPSKNALYDKVEVAGPGFLNFYLSSKFLEKELKEILVKGEKYGYAKKKKEKIFIEYSQPNTNKPQHIGHMRNNLLGVTLGKILKTAGYKVILANYSGDIGVHITKSMLAYMKWGKGETPQSSGIKPDHFVGKYYVMFSQKSEADPKLTEEAQELLRKWEAGDKQVRTLWKQMNNWAYEGWKATYDRQGVSFDDWFYESEFSESGKEVVDEALEKGVAQRLEDGAVIAYLKQYGLDDKILLRRDGTSVYATKDLKLAERSYEKYHYDRRIYCVGSDQSSYLKQIFKILELLGYEYAKKCYHLAYGMVYLQDGKMSSREGRVIYADDLMNQAHNKARQELDQRYPDWSDVEKEKVAEAVGIGAMKYSILKIDAVQDIHFDLDQTISFEGNTGPYLQYTYARICQIMKQSKLDQEAPVESLREPEEKMLLRKLYLYPETVQEAAANYKPSLIANYLYDLATAFNGFYHKHSVLKAEEEIKQARLKLVAATAQVLRNGLELLSIEAPSRM